MIGYVMILGQQMSDESAFISSSLLVPELSRTLNMLQIFSQSDLEYVTNFFLVRSLD
jgi:hypothetical protein